MSELPKGWTKTSIEQIVEFNPKHDPNLARDVEVSFVPMPAVSEHTGEIVSADTRPASAVLKGYTHFQNGDVLFAKITPCMENGKAAVAWSLTNGLGCGSTEFHVMRPAGAVDASFLWRFVRQKSFRVEAEGVMTGAVGQRRVPTAFLKSYPFLLPPLAEQRRIVAKLDALDASSKRARADLDRIPALVARAKQAILEKAFRGNLEPSVGHAALEDQPWPLPASWRWVRFDEVVKIASNLVSPATIPELPHIAPDNIESGTGRLLPFRTIAEDEVISPKHRFFPGQVLYSKIRPYLKKSVIVDFAGACSADMYPLSTGSEILANYLHLWTISDDFALMTSQHEGRTVLPKINQKALSGTLIPLPTLVEQKRIALQIKVAFAKIDHIAAEAASASALLNRLDQALLSKAFRGELVPQDPADEPASELLARIQTARAATPKAKRARRTKETP